MQAEIRKKAILTRVNQTHRMRWIPAAGHRTKLEFFHMEEGLMRRHNAFRIAVAAAERGAV
jgi:hypothetical protein